MIKKRSGRKQCSLPLPVPLVAVVLLICATYKYILPLKVEMVGWPAQLLPLALNESNRVVIQDFFKPYDPAYPTSLPTKNYYRKINLRPLAPYRTSGANFSAWLEEQTSTSFEKLLANIGDSSYNSLREQGVAEGAVIASPSKEKPDYFYQWPRDAAITVNTVVSNLVGSDKAVNLTLAGTIVKYLNNSAVLQRVPNPSGQGVGGSDPQLKGLGEPKFEVDSSAFTGNWGRPQNDGAPLRLIATFHFLQRLCDAKVDLKQLIAELQGQGQGQELRLSFHDEESLFETLIRYDLEFVTQNWKVDSFDLWEEVKGHHFFTSLVQLAATKQGLHYMKTHGRENDPLAQKLQQAANKLNDFLTLEGGFLNPNKNYIVETPSNLNSRSGLDVAVLIASLLTHAEDEGEGSSPHTNLPFGVNDSGILNTLHSLVSTMAIIYPVNHQRHSPRMGVALGRYPEDVYDGIGTSEGNPWFLATSHAAQLLYQLIHKMYADQSDLEIPVNTWESKFWTSIFEGFEEYPSGGVLAGGGDYRLIIPYKSPAFHQTMVSLLNYGDSFLDKLREHVGEDGSMSEQFNKYTGIMQGARELTWSHGAFWSSSHVREQVLPLISSPN
ncbi:SGA1 (YIL099W) [Zygosaccharomyces parabailii]|nr:SGA1 (YIL099W) [Zygosaccharomyces parabailii]